MILDDAIADGKAQPRPDAHAFGGETGVENALSFFSLDSMPGIREL